MARASVRLVAMAAVLTPIAALDLAPRAQGAASACAVLVVILGAFALEGGLAWRDAAFGVGASALVGVLIWLSPPGASAVAAMFLVAMGSVWLEHAGVLPSFTAWWDRLPGPSKDPADYR